MRREVMKRVSEGIVLLLVILSLVACGNKAQSVPGDQVENTEEVVTGNDTSASDEAEIDTAPAEKGSDALSIQSDADKSADTDKSKKTDNDGNGINTQKENDSKTGTSKDNSVSDTASKDSSVSDIASKDKESNTTSKNNLSSDIKSEDAPDGNNSGNVSDKKQEGYGRILFTGDSRTVDLFSAQAEEIRGDVHNGIPVYCKNGCQFQYMVDAINEYGMDNFDTLVSWMGCNEFGDFSQYGPYYDSLIESGKTIVVCTVGPTVDDQLLNDVDYLYYPNANQIKYNNSLTAWANERGVKVIDLYSYISNSSTISVVPGDGIHYLPQPTTELWTYILGSLGR